MDIGNTKEKTTPTGHPDVLSMLAALEGLAQQEDGVTSWSSASGRHRFFLMSSDYLHAITIASGEWSSLLINSSRNGPMKLIGFDLEGPLTYLTVVTGQLLKDGSITIEGEEVLSPSTTKRS
jgi:hypothetical protein